MTAESASLMRKDMHAPPPHSALLDFNNAVTYLSS
jgi:hypothetical protein